MSYYKTNNRGTFEGTVAEVEFVKKFNNGMFREFISKTFPDKVGLFCVHVITNQYSSLSMSRVKPKADAFLIKASESLRNEIQKNSFYLCESDLTTIPHEVVSNSGISIKLADSQKYQIHKFTMQSFLKVFEDRYMGAGALIYTRCDSDINDNQTILNSWELTSSDFYGYFSKKIGSNASKTPENLSKIQRYCTSSIKNRILNCERISDMVFNGKGVFESPYFAQYSFIHGILSAYQKCDFVVTQGSNRKKNPTIVIKPV